MLIAATFASALLLAQVLTSPGFQQYPSHHGTNTYPTIEFKNQNHSQKLTCFNSSCGNGDIVILTDNGTRNAYTYDGKNWADAKGENADKTVVPLGVDHPVVYVRAAKEDGIFTVSGEIDMEYAEKKAKELAAEKKGEPKKN